MPTPEYLAICCRIKLSYKSDLSFLGLPIGHLASLLVQLIHEV